MIPLGGNKKKEVGEQLEEITRLILQTCVSSPVATLEERCRQRNGLIKMLSSCREYR